MNVHPLFIDQVMVLISAAIMESFNTDEQGIIGGFLNTLGTLIEFNAAYLQYITPPANNDIQDDSQSDNYETLQKGIEKIEEELKKIKESHQEA